MSINGVSTRAHIGGLASGLDTDTMISDLMKAERMPLNKVLQGKQLKEWKRDDYRSIISSLSELNKTYMDVVNPTTNMRSQAQYKKFAVNITNNSSVANLTAVGTTSATTGTHTVVVKSLATSAKEVSATPVSAPLQSGNIKGTIALTDKKMNITLDGVTKEITFTSNVTINDQDTGDAFATEFQNLVKDAFGLGISNEPKVTVGYDDSTGKLVFNTSGGATKIVFSSGKTNDALSGLAIANLSSNRIDTSLSLSDLKSSFGGNNGLMFFNDNGTDKLAFTINNKEFTFTSATKLNTVINTINNDPTANVNFTYDASTDKFTISAKQTGVGKTISITNTWGNFFDYESSLGINPEGRADFGTSGQDAVVTIDNQDLTRSSNTFTEAGIQYTLTKADPLTVNTVNLTTDVQSIYDNISNFVKKYNEVLEKINTKLNEKYDKSYAPLTDEQRTAMKDTDITNWEAKAKTGLLRNDSTLQKIVSDMRMKMIEPVDGVNISLASIGVSSLSYTDLGKLTINETKLKQSIQNDADGVMNLFSKQSDTLSSYDRKATGAQRISRYKEEGLANRLYDIIQDNISIMMDSNKQKGFLLQKAGMLGDSTDSTSILSKQINDDIKSVSNWETKLSAKEDAYLKKFSAMEKALSKFSSQSSWISSQLSSSSSS